MDDFPVKIADLLEAAATRVRSLTVERVAGWARWAAVGVIVALLGLVMAIFIMVALFRLLAGLVTPEGAYAILGGIFVVAGILLWRQRLAEADDEIVTADETAAERIATELREL
jgi:hypothetical protein